MVIFCKCPTEPAVFSHASSSQGVSLSVHHFSPNWNIFILLAYMSMNKTLLQKSLVLSQCSLNKQCLIWTTIKRTAMKFCTDIHGPQRMKAGCLWWLPDFFSHTTTRLTFTVLSESSRQQDDFSSSASISSKLYFLQFFGFWPLWAFAALCFSSN